MGDRKPTHSIPPKTEDIDTEWGHFDPEAPTAPGEIPSDRPTAVPPEPVEQMARRLMAGAMTAEEEKRALSQPAFRAVEAIPARPEMPTLIDDNAGTYDLDSLEATIPQVTSPVAHRTPRPRSIPLDLPEGGGGALDLVSGRSAPPMARPPEDPMVEMRDRYAVGDFTGALAVAEKVLSQTPSNAEASRYVTSCRDILTQMYTARLGSTSQVPKVVLAADQIRWLTLDHRSGFLLSCIDGVSTVEEILDVSGMQGLDALRILCELLQQGVIEMRARR